MPQATEYVELHHLKRYQILHELGSASDPVLVLSTEAGDYHCLVTRSDLLKLSRAFAKCAETLDD